MYEMLGCERVVCCGNFDGIKHKYISYKKGDSSFEVSSLLLDVRCCYFAFVSSLASISSSRISLSCFKFI